MNAINGHNVEDGSHHTNTDHETNTGHDADPVTKSQTHRAAMRDHLDRGEAPEAQAHFLASYSALLDGKIDRIADPDSIDSDELDNADVTHFLSDEDWFIGEMAKMRNLTG